MCKQQLKTSGRATQPGYYVIEYQEGSTDHHYATTGVVPLVHVLQTFYKYLRGDESWKADLDWEHMPL